MDFFLLLPVSLLLLGDALGQYCQENEDRHGVITGALDGPSGLMCYRQRSGDVAPLHCTWTAGMELPQYKLCYCCDKCKNCKSFVAGNETKYTVPRDDLYLEKNLTFWVEATAGGIRVKSEKLYIVPKSSIKYDAPRGKEIELVRSEGMLILTWQKPEERKIQNEIRYRSLDARKWKQTICISNELEAQETCKIHLESSSAYKLQIRRILHGNGIMWSEWSKTIFIPAEITQSLDLRWAFLHGLSEQCPGERYVQLQWQPPTDPNIRVTSYSLTFQPALNKTSFTQKPQNKSSYRTAISLAPYNISIVALNRVGASKTETIYIPPAPPKETPDLNITVLNNHTLKASWIHHRVQFYCIILELVSVAILSNTCQSRKELKIKNKTGMVHKVFERLEPLKLYRITVHTNSSKAINGCRSETGYTIGSGTACTQEQPPTCGPDKVKVTNIRKTSVLLEWKAMSLGPCQGSLQKYLIIYRDLWNHTHTAAVNSSTLSFTLLNLNASTLYTVEICGVTSAGQGTETLRNFQTKDYDQNELTAIVVGTSISVMLAVFIIASFCYFSVKRSKQIICPTIPDPVNSVAVRSMHSSVHPSHWTAYSDDQDVTDVLVVMVNVQSDTSTPSANENVEDEMMSMMEGGDFCHDNNSFSSDSNAAFEYRRQMGGPLAMEEDQSAEGELKQSFQTEGTQLVNNDISPLCLQSCSGSILNLCGNVISLLAVYDENLTEQDTGRYQAE
ncbi:interleukin-12 receptor subunit beta-1 isoform X2 [Heterodontus francisci]|uniref:interleukin-12 receptor subunit beta-1 isoform X2 n=1 Tax=Heterodontus francisci TaxID=7792 RepID=UPI00355B2F3F